MPDDFAKWLRGDDNWSFPNNVELRDLANLCAGLYDAAGPFEAFQDKATNPRVGLTQPVTVAEAEALNAALATCRGFMEKYGQPSIDPSLLHRWCAACGRNPCVC